ncbi:TonB-dependent receptor [Xanthomonas sp. D-109]|uniref:TonB-dependent receptor plug domain-containing protein n=1 Tax=Xanthomonas sp. D-109 TaxID=2821274 RepID=UPI001ADA41BF|nr:TonB-dependent receptor [Xanthomonas sp. D-109]MBO9883282.1 TonB-dependent receptor [Xanthomonas sp. D-109]
MSNVHADEADHPLLAVGDRAPSEFGASPLFRSIDTDPLLSALVQTGPSPSLPQNASAMKKPRAWPRRPLRLCRHALSLTLITPGFAFAQSTAPAPIQTTDTPTELEAVKVTGTTTVEQRRTEATNRIVIDRTEILKHNDDSLSSVMRRLPGITVSPTDGIRMRGLGSGYIQILVDGTPVASDFSIDSIAPELIERIEILPTPVAEYSTRSIVGTINIVLRKNTRSTQRVLKLSAGRNGSGWTPSLSLLLSDKTEDFAWSLTASGSRTSDRVGGRIIDRELDASATEVALRDTRERYEDQLDTVSLAPRLNWTFDNGDTLSWQSLLQHDDEQWQRNRRETTILGGPSDYPYNLWINRSRTWSGRSDIDWMHNVNDSDSLSVKLGATYLKRDTDFSFLGYAPSDVLALDRFIVSDAVDSSVTSVGKYLTHIGEDHGLAFGWDGAFTRRQEHRLQQDRSAQGTLLGIVDEDYTADVSRIALYGQDEWQATPTLQVYVGVRWEGFDTAVSGRTIDSVGNRSSVFSPIGQLLWKPWADEQDQFRIGIARTFSAPAPTRLVPRRYTVNNANGPTNPDQEGNPDLRPEIAWGLDVAYEHYFGDGGMTSLSAYARSIDDVTTDLLLERDGIWIVSPVNSGRAQAHGLTLETKFALKDVWQNARADVDLQGNLTRNWSQVDSIPGPRNRLATQIPLSGTLGATWRPSTALSLGLDFSYQGGNRSRVTDRWDMSSRPVRTLDLFAQWKLDEASKFTFTISNALHQPQTETNTYTDGTGSISRLYSVDTTTGVKLLYERKL